MILRATFENIYSFNERTSISFVAGKSTAHPSHVSHAKQTDDISALKLGIIYGANASGKSNVLKAVALIQQIALGHFPLNDFEPFKLSNDVKPFSIIEIEFKTEGKYFAYGVEFSTYGIKKEWLYKINSNSDKKIFVRVNSEYTRHFEFGKVTGNPETKSLIRILGVSTPLKKSFLSEYIDGNGTGLNPIKTAYNWFSKGLKIIFPNTRYSGISFNTQLDEDFHEATRKLLKHFNTGIVDIRRFGINSKEETNLPKSLVEQILNSAIPGRTTLVANPESKECFLFDFKEEGTYTIYQLKTVYLDQSGQEVVFNMEDESEGIIQLLDFIPMLVDLGNGEITYMIDEFDRSLHPLISKEILECYLRNLSDSRDSQLIISTHEDYLLDLNTIRPDEVWFIKKDQDGASHPVSLVEYKPRENVQKGYLQGRYGAIPVFPWIL